MARKINQLTPLKVEQLVKRTKKARSFGDGLGLYLIVRRQGEGAWAFRYKVNKQPKLMGLGPVHTVSLQEARERAKQARQLILDGKDPLAVKREARAEAKALEVRTMTFEQAAEQFIATDKIQKLKDKAAWARTLGYLYPAIGNLPLEQIDSAVVLNALLPVVKRTGETGTRLRGRVERVFAWAKAHKLFAGENPANRDVLKDALPAKPKAKHHTAMSYADLPAFMAGLSGRNGVSALALQFTILTAARTGETIGARWSEIDLKAKTWTIPGDRMKASKAHTVPLSDAALAILAAIPRNGAHVFINGGGKPISNMAMLNLLKGIDSSLTVHGFRAAFKTWARERTHFDRDTIEACLAHTLQSKVEAAYVRGDNMVDKRRQVMSAWARYCLDALVAHTDDNVLPLRA